jgi:hypothetical protein
MSLLFMSVESKVQKLGRQEELCTGSGCAAWVGVQNCYGKLSCICSIVDSDGSDLVDCGSCLALNGDVDDSVSIAQLSSLCDLSTDCDIKPACQTVIETYTECSNSACFCTSALPALPVCASCHAYVNITLANALSSEILTCSSQIYGLEALTTGFISSSMPSPGQGSADLATTEASTALAPGTTSKIRSSANPGRDPIGLVTTLTVVAFVVGMAAL